MSLDVLLPGPSGWKARVAGKSQKRRGVGCMRVGEPLLLLLRCPLLPLRCPLPPAAASPSAVACILCGGESDIAGSDAGSDGAREGSRRGPPPDFEICTQTKS